MADVSCGQDEPPPKVRRSGEAAGREGADRVHINSLPDELLISIFSSLSFNDLIDTVQNVCVRWRRLAHEPVLWLDKEYVVKAGGWLLYGRSCCGVYFSQCRHCRSTGRDREVSRDADRMPQLRTLTLMRGLKAAILRKLCDNCPHLTSLQMHAGQKLDYPLLKYIFEKCPKIQKLQMTESLLANRQCAELVSHLEHLKRLEIIADYVNYHDEPGVPVRVLADACPRLEEINFDACSYPLADLDHFFKAKKHSITSATVPWTVGPEDGRMLVVPLLKQCDATLRKLRLCNFDVPSELTAAAFEGLSELHNLHELVIKEEERSPTANISLVFRPGCLTQLRRLHVRSVFFFDNDTLLGISRDCANLRELRIDHTLITDEGLSEIHRLKHLEVLEVSGCYELGGAAVAHVSHLPALRTLVLRDFEPLSELLPGLQLIADMAELRCLDILGNRDIAGVPFSEFPHRLTKLRELYAPCEGEKELFYKNLFAELLNKMPYLKISNDYYRTEDDFVTDDETGDDYSDISSNGSSDNDHRKGCNVSISNDSDGMDDQGCFYDDTYSYYDSG